MPIEIHLFERGLQAICMDSNRLPEILRLSETAIKHLRQEGLVRVPPPMPQSKKGIDYEALRQTYARMLTEGPFNSQAELARHLGVSRVWVSRVLKGNGKKEEVEGPPCDVPEDGHGELMDRSLREATRAANRLNGM